VKPDAPPAGALHDLVEATVALLAEGKPVRLHLDAAGWCIRLEVAPSAGAEASTAAPAVPARSTAVDLYVG
jgi:hypothetical protein